MSHRSSLRGWPQSGSGGAGIAIGGDSFPGSTLSDHCLRYQNIPQIKLIVVLGELGGRDEYSLVEALQAGKVGLCMDSLHMHLQQALHVAR